MDKYKGAVFGLAYDRIGDFELARDIAQEAFVRAYIELGTLREHSKFANWLYVIASNLCREYLRSRSLQAAALETELEWLDDVPGQRRVLPPGFGKNPSKTPEENWEEKNLREAILAAIHALPPKTKEAVILYYMDGLTSKDVADFLNISPDAVRSRLGFGRRKLREEMIEMVERTLKREAPAQAFTEDVAERIRRIFEHHVAPTVLDELMKRPEAVKLDGEKRHMTALFTDIASFSRISAFKRSDPQELIALLNDYLTEMTDIILKYEGTVDKFEGDAIICFFGAPLPCEDHAEQACLAAIDMQDRLSELREEWRAKGRPQLYARIGINTGPMIVGNMGARQIEDYTIMGDAVNLAARIEGLGRQYGTGTLIGESTYTEAQDKIEGRELDTISMRAMPEPVTVYEVLSRKGALDDLKSQIVQLYGEGLAAYREGRWEEAAEHFRSALKLDPEDCSSKLMLARCEQYKHHPPENWRGLSSLE